MMHVLEVLFAIPIVNFFVGLFVGLFFGGMIGAWKTIQAQQRRDASFFDRW